MTAISSSFASLFPMPKDATTANRHAKRYEAAVAILEAGYTFERDEEIGMTAVCKPGELHAAYWICDRPELVAPKGGCSCPDYDRHGDLCKHTIAEKILKYQAWKEEEAGKRFEEEQANYEGAESSNDGGVRW